MIPTMCDEVEGPVDVGVSFECNRCNKEPSQQDLIHIRISECGPWMHDRTHIIKVIKWAFLFLISFGKRMSA